MEQNNTNNPSQKTGGKNTTMAILAYFIFFLPLLTGDAKKDSFVKYHTKQGLVLFLLVVLISILGWMMPFYYWWTFRWILDLAVLILLILGVKNAASGKEQPLPVIGSFSKMFKF